MAKLDLGAIGAVPGLSYADRGEALDSAVELEELGYAALWLAGEQDNPLDRVAEVIAATRRIPVGTGIVSVDQVPAAAVSATYAAAPDRYLVGLGGAHGAHPIATLQTYLDDLAGVPADRIVLAALGPRMLRLARDRVAGAYPVLITPDYTARAREALGPDTSLIVSQLVVLETDSARAREIALGPLGFLRTMPAYQANFRRMGFTDEEVQAGSDRFVDALVAHGDLEAIARRVTEHRQAGADQVAVQLVGSSAPRADWRRLAEALIAYR